VVEHLHHQTPQFDTLPKPLFPYEEGHPAWRRFCLRFPVLEHVARVIEWLKMELEEYEAAEE